MKGSAVFLGLKDWASKALHPQLPLNARESQKLLTTLTGSFRKHLDEVHPPIAGKPQPRLGTVKSSNASPRTLHSSAALADKHLSSILTSPLLSKRSGYTSKEDQDFANCKVELQKDTKDPISLLEEYDARGAATLPIALLCMTTFEKYLTGLSLDQQKKAVSETEPGRRTLMWLWRSELHQTAAFVDGVELMKVMTNALMRESLDEYLWEWLGLDMVLAHQWDSTRSQNARRELFHGYRWKGRILRKMIEAKLQPPYGQKPDLNEVLDIFFRAVSLRDMAKKGDHLQYLPLNSAGAIIHQALTRMRYQFGEVEPRRYARFKDLINTWMRGKGKGTGIRLNMALMDLYHPTSTKISGLPMIHTLQELFSPDPSTDVSELLAEFKSSGNEENHLWYLIMVLTVYRLQIQGYTEEAVWVQDKISEHFPRLDYYTHSNLQQFVNGTRWNGQHVDGQRPTGAINAATNRVPYPAFT
ncbi:hypothetical protein LTR22_023602 [Elasticomyces elasticus]|nr:hypothetical protein LTR22_023602 [Elasticomyces elasticus]KAK4905986.1 hypothetical protein LTR49_024799 [Elasticomyces elasticus]KAK5756453.1 hypothetical protein LTS12_013407 [Elasticomyces elasticus]